MTEGGRDLGGRGEEMRKEEQDQVWDKDSREGQRAKRMNGNKKPQGVGGGGTLQRPER